MPKTHPRPTRTPARCVVVVTPFGPHHCATCSGEVQASKTRSRGASKTRVEAISRSAVLLLSVVAFMFLLLRFFQFAQVFVQAVEALLPETAVVIEPVGHLFEP